MTSGAVADLTEVADGVYIRPMLSLSHAIDAYLDDAGLAQRSIDSYRSTLYRFADQFPDHTDVAKITRDDIRSFRAARRRTAAQTTVGIMESHIASFFRWLHDEGKIKHNPMSGLRRTKRIPAEDLEVLTVSAEDVARLLLEARPGRELNAIAIAAYLGPRLNAIAQLKLPDYNQQTQEILFREKGRKAIVKPVPDELAEILGESIGRGDLRAEPFDYLVPPLGSPHSGDRRDPTIIRTLVKEVAKRAGVVTNVHALRRAFACFYITANPRDLLGLKELLGHRSVDTTMRYIKAFDRAERMAPVRSLSWQREVERLSAPLSETADNPYVGEAVAGIASAKPTFAPIQAPDSDPAVLSKLDLLGELLRGVRGVGELA